MTEVVSIKNLIDAVNEVRVDKNLSPLTVNESLMQSAEMRGYAICRTGNYSHDGWKDVVQLKYDYQSAGENLARGYSSTEAMVSAWVNSPEHYKNIINKEYKETGVAVVNCGDTTYTVQHFGAQPDTIENIVLPVVFALLCIVIIIGGIYVNIRNSYSRDTRG